MSGHSMTDAERATWFALRQGAAHARTLSDLREETGLSEREQQAAIEALRALSFEPICAGARGYYEAATVAELDAYMRQFDERLRTMVRTLHGLRKAGVRMAEEAEGSRPIRGRWAA
jgi:hypothetical protein